MMKALLLTFAVMFVFGAYLGMWGGALLALCMVGFMIYAMRVFAKQDAAYRASPEYARKPRATQEILDEAGTECSTPKDLP